MSPTPPRTSETSPSKPSRMSPTHITRTSPSPKLSPSPARETSPSPTRETSPQSHGASPRTSPSPGASPVKSPVTAPLPPLRNGAPLTLNITKRRKVDHTLSPTEQKQTRSNAAPDRSPPISHITPSKRSVSTPARLPTPRGGRRTPSLADRPIPVLIPQDDDTDVRARSRRSSYAHLYDFESSPLSERSAVVEKPANDNPALLPSPELAPDKAANADSKVLQSPKK